MPLPKVKFPFGSTHASSANSFYKSKVNDALVRRLKRRCKRDGKKNITNNYLDKQMENGYNDDDGRKNSYNSPDLDNHLENDYNDNEDCFENATTPRLCKFRRIR